MSRLKRQTANVMEKTIQFYVTKVKFWEMNGNLSPYTTMDFIITHNMGRSNKECEIHFSGLAIDQSGLYLRKEVLQESPYKVIRILSNNLPLIKGFLNEDARAKPFEIVYNEEVKSFARACFYGNDSKNLSFTHIDSVGMKIPLSLEEKLFFTNALFRMALDYRIHSAAEVANR